MPMIAPKRLREIITEKYPDDYVQKTEVGKSFVAMHRDSKIIDNLGDKGGTEAQFKGGTKEAPYNKQSKNAGFPAEDEFNDYNLPTHYKNSDVPSEEGEDYEYSFEDDDNDIDNDRTRSRIANDGTSEETVNEAQPSKKEIKSAEKQLEAGRFKKKVKKEEIEEPGPKSFLQHLDEQALTRKHFREVANTVRAIEDPKKRQEYADHHAGIFAKANPRFDFKKFHAAAGTQFTKGWESVGKK